METAAREIVAEPVVNLPLAPEPASEASEKVLRFRLSERRLHWAIALPFLGCFTTALVLVFVYNPDPVRPYRVVLSTLHRISGLFLIVLPLLAVTFSHRDFRIHFRNVKQAWVWVLSDVKWLALFGLAAINKRIPLPEQGKFNAAQKLNFMMVMSTYPFYVLTGSLMWITGAALWSWLLHFFLALVATPFLIGHIFMATVPRDTRAALQGMFSGFVDRQWAKHHHARWYRQEHGQTRVQGPVSSVTDEPLEHVPLEHVPLEHVPAEPVPTIPLPTHPDPVADALW